MNLAAVTTTFYRYIDGDEVQYSYQPYDVWCFLTRIRSYVHRNYAGNIEAKLISVQGKTRNQDILTVVLQDGINPIPMSPKDIKLLQAAVDEIQSHNIGYALLVDAFDPVLDRNAHEMPRHWVHYQLQYLSLPHNIPHMYHDGRIYVYLADRNDYDMAYETLNENIIKELQDRYHNGYIYTDRTDEINGLRNVSDDGHIKSVNWDNDSNIALAPMIMDYLSQSDSSIDQDINSIRNFLNSPKQFASASISINI